jgi:hypothetical protein
VMKSKELKTKIYSHAHSLILTRCLYLSDRRASGADGCFEENTRRSHQLAFSTIGRQQHDKHRASASGFTPTLSLSLSLSLCIGKRFVF